MHSGCWPRVRFQSFRSCLPVARNTCFRRDGLVAFEVDGPGISVFLQVLDANAALDLGPGLGRELQKGLVEDAAG